MSKNHEEHMEAREKRLASMTITGETYPRIMIEAIRNGYIGCICVPLPPPWLFWKKE